MSVGERQEPSRLRLGLALALLLVAAFGIRIWYASESPNFGRFWDEQYTFDNVRPIVLKHEFSVIRGYYPSPVVNLPPALLIMASEKLAEWTGNPSFRAMAGDGLTPVGVMLCRGLMTVHGILAIVMTFLVGRLLFSWQVGILAAAAIAASPWNIHSSGYFKPDPLLLFTVLLAFYWSVRAAESASFRDHVFAGGAIALAMSAKLTGGMIAVPLIVSTAMLGRQNRRYVWLLCLAGATAFASFVLLNPGWTWYPSFLSGLKADYLLRAEMYESSRFDIPVGLVGLIVGKTGLGALIGGASLIGTVLLVASAWKTERPLHRVNMAMFFAFPLIYTIVYMAQTPYFKGNNFLPLLPFAAIAGSWLVHTVWRRVGEWLPIFATTGASVAVVLVLIAIASRTAVFYVYDSLTRTTNDVAMRFVETTLKPSHGRLVRAELWVEGEPVWERRRHFTSGLSALSTETMLHDLSVEELSQTDAIIFPARRLTGEHAAFYRKLADSYPEDAKVTFDPYAFNSRGEPMFAAVSVRHSAAPDVRLGTMRCGEDRTGCTNSIFPPEIAGGELVTLFVWIDTKAIATSVELPDHAMIGDQRVDLVHISSKGTGHLLLAPRFELGSPLPGLTLESLAEEVQVKHVKIMVSRWAAEGVPLEEFAESQPYPSRLARIYWRNYATGVNATWRFEAGTYSGFERLDDTADPGWQIRGVGDMNGDGLEDVVWRHREDGRNTIWFLDAELGLTSTAALQRVDLVWELNAVGDLDGDGQTDLLWQRRDSEVTAVWLMNGHQLREFRTLAPSPSPASRLVAAADFDRDGRLDLVFRDSETGANLVRLMNGVEVRKEMHLPVAPDPDWAMVGVIDFDGDDQIDIIWRHRRSGTNLVWLMDGFAIRESRQLTPQPDLDYVIAAASEGVLPQEEPAQ